jgi:hypothetical protein
MKYQGLLPASQEMRDWCSLLGQEMLHWPGVKMCHVFGTCAFYHRKVMFAMLPGERSLDTSTTISFKAPAAGESRQGADWRSFELTNGTQVSEALASLQKAYRESVSHPSPDPPILSRSLMQFRHASHRDDSDRQSLDRPA